MLHETILQIRDENGLGEVYHELTLSFSTIEVSVREIIAERVREEVVLYNRRTADYQRHALVKPTELEARLNPEKKRHQVDVEKQIDIALKAFLGNGFFVLVDNIQVEELDQLISIKPDTTVSFIKLTPLVGG